MIYTYIDHVHLCCAGYGHAWALSRPSGRARRVRRADLS
jgi:hypothetical protein